MEDIFKLMISYLKQICLDLRPASIINRHIFDQFYYVLESRQIELKKLEFIPTNFAAAILYTAFSILNQCKYSETESELRIEFKLFIRSILRAFDAKSNSIQLNDEWIDINSRAIKTDDFISVISMIHDLQMRNKIEDVKNILSVLFKTNELT